MIHSFLLIGQSNMAGRGNPDEVELVKDKRILVMRNGRWQKMFRPVNPDRSFSGVCLAEKFAQLYAEKYDVQVGLIPCADGGTSLHQWQPGSLLYDNAVNCARLAQRTSTIAGVLWHQGESDCHDGRYQTYKERIKPIMDGFRKDLNLYDVPFLLGGLGDYLPNCEKFRECVNYEHVNKALMEFAEEQERFGFVPADGLKPNEDNLHFSAPALYEFGERYFKKFEELRDPGKVFLEKAHPDDAIRSAMENL